MSWKECMEEGSHWTQCNLVTNKDRGTDGTDYWKGFRKNK